MWIIEPDILDDEQPWTAVIHLDSVIYLDNSIEKPCFFGNPPPSKKKLKDDFLHVQKILIKSENILREPSLPEECPINSSEWSDQPMIYKL